MAETIGEALVRIRPDTRTFAQEAEGGIGGSLRTLGTMGVAAFTAMGVAAGGLATKGIQVAMANETARVSFTKMMGDNSAAADEFMQKLIDFSAKTPFELPQLRSAASMLLSVGTAADQVIPLMQALGDATAATGTGAEGIQRATFALQKMQLVGRATGESMMMLSEAGVNVWDAVAAKLGVTVADAQEKVRKGQLEVNTVFAALSEYAGPSMQAVQGMMDKQSATLQGLWSTLKDTFGQGLATMMAPTVNALRGSLGGLNDALMTAFKSAGPAISGLATTLVGVVTKLAPVLAQALGPVSQVFASVFTALGPLFDRLGPLVASLTPVFARLSRSIEALMPAVGPIVDLLGNLVVTALDALFSAVEPLIGPLADMAGMLAGALNTALLAIAPVLGEVASMLGEALGLALASIAPYLPQLADAFVQILVALLPLLPPLTQLALTLLPPLLDLLILLLPAVTSIANALANGLGKAVEYVVPYLERFAPVLAEALAKIGPFVELVVTGFRALAGAFANGDVTSDGFVGTMERIGVVLRNVYDVVVPVAQAIGRALVTAFRATVEWVQANWPKIREVIGGVVEWIAANVWPVIRTVMANIIPAIATVVEWIATNFPKVVNTIRAVVDWIATNVVPPIAQVVGFVIEQFRNLMTWVEEWGPKLLDALRTIFTPVLIVVGAVFIALREAWELFGPPIMAAVKAFAEFIGQVFETGFKYVKAVFEATWNAIGPVVKAALDLIRNVVEAFINLFTGQWGALWDNIKGIFSAMWSGLWAIAKAQLTILWEGVTLFFTELLPAAGKLLWNVGTAILRGLWEGLVWFFTAEIKVQFKILTWIKDLIVDAGTWLYETGWNILSGLWNGIFGFFEAIFKSAFNLRDWIMPLIGDALSWLYQKGKDIIQGLWNGIKEVWDNLWSWLKGAAGALIDWLNPFDFGSPSRLMRSQGQLIMEGLRVGLADGFVAVSRDLDEYSRSMADRSWETGGFTAPVPDTAGVDGTARGRVTPVVALADKGALVHIEHATFNEPVDVDAFGRMLSFQLGGAA